MRILPLTFYTGFVRRTWDFPASGKLQKKKKGRKKKKED